VKLRERGSVKLREGGRTMKERESDENDGKKGKVKL